MVFLTLSKYINSLLLGLICLINFDKQVLQMVSEELLSVHGQFVAEDVIEVLINFLSEMFSWLWSFHSSLPSHLTATEKLNA